MSEAVSFFRYPFCLVVVVPRWVFHFAKCLVGFCTCPVFDLYVHVSLAVFGRVVCRWWEVCFDVRVTKEDCATDLFALKELEYEFQLDYPVVIGCLLWILNTYPRLQFAIRKLAKYMRLPGRTHFRAIQHLLHHIRCNHAFGLTYYSEVLDSPLAKLLFSNNIDPLEYPIFVFADSSWQDCHPKNLLMVAAQDRNSWE